MYFWEKPPYENSEHFYYCCSAWQHVIYFLMWVWLRIAALRSLVTNTRPYPALCHIRDTHRSPIRMSACSARQLGLCLLFMTGCHHEAMKGSSVYTQTFPVFTCWSISHGEILDKDVWHHSGLKIIFGFSTSHFTKWVDLNGRLGTLLFLVLE